MLTLTLLTAVSAHATEVCPDIAVDYTERECTEFTPYEETCVYSVSVQLRVPVVGPLGGIGCASATPMESLCFAEYGDCPAELPADLPDLCHPDPSEDPDDPCPDIVQTNMGSGLGHEVVEGCCVDLLVLDQYPASLFSDECLAEEELIVWPNVGFYPGECLGDQAPDFPDLPIGDPPMDEPPAP
ncbi:MAG: hypothetical protein KTR31_29400 [Myxococcales bacterium]|nr:hypothetical protein [Myxococcales bacterium]